MCITLPLVWISGFFGLLLLLTPTLLSPSRQPFRRQTDKANKEYTFTSTSSKPPQEPCVCLSIPFASFRLSAPSMICKSNQSELCNIISLPFFLTKKQEQAHVSAQKGKKLTSLCVLFLSPSRELCLGHAGVLFYISNWAARSLIS